MDLPKGWGLNVFASHTRPGLMEILKDLEGISSLRVQVSPSGVHESLPLALQAIKKVEDAGFEVIIGPVDSWVDYKYEDKLYRWIESISEEFPNRWWILDTETQFSKFIRGGATRYLEVMPTVSSIIHDYGGKTIGPGMVHGNRGDLEQILSSMRFDSPSIHAYTDRGWSDYTKWLSDARSIMVSHGYNHGVLGEIGETGKPRNFFQKIQYNICEWKGDTVQLKRLRKLKRHIDKQEFWKLKIYYQVLDSPASIFSERYSGFGLVVGTNNNWETKPSFKLFQ